MHLRVYTNEETSLICHDVQNLIFALQSSAKVLNQIITLSTMIFYILEKNRSRKEMSPQTAMDNKSFWDIVA